MRFLVMAPVCLLAGLGAGLAFFHEPRLLTSAAAATLRERKPTRDTAASPDSAQATDATAQRLIAVCLRKGGGIERDNEMYLAIEAFTAADIHRVMTDPGALKAIAEKLHGIDWQTSRNLASAIVARWLKVDPSTLVRWAPRILDLAPAKDSSRGLILDALAAKRPEETLALLASCKDANEREDIILPSLRELAARDLRKAQAWLSGCADPADRRVAEKAIRLGTVKSDPLRAVELADSLESRQEGNAILLAAVESAAKNGPAMLRRLATTPMEPWMLSSVLQQFADLEPEEAVDLAVNGGSHQSDGTLGLQSAFTALARKDPETSIAKLEGLTGVELAAAVSAIGRGWADREPAKALDWLAQRTPSDRADPNRSMGSGNDALLATFANWAEYAPADARAWADALPLGSTHTAVQSQLARALAARGEPAEATQVLARLGAAADPKALADTAEIWARRDPQAAAAWAVAQEPGPAQSRALAGVVSTWANDDPEGVWNWLAQFPPGEARDRSIKAYLWRGTAWTESPEERLAEFDAWFDVISDPWHRAMVARSSFWQRKQRDPAGARAWLSSLTNVDPELIRMTLRDNAD